jgi:hypothetical protein
MGAKNRRTGAVVGGAEVYERRRRHGPAQAILLARWSFPWKPELRLRRGGGDGSDGGAGVLAGGKGRAGLLGQKESNTVRANGSWCFSSTHTP